MVKASRFRTIVDGTKLVGLASPQRLRPSYSLINLELSGQFAEVVECRALQACFPDNLDRCLRIAGEFASRHMDVAFFVKIV